MIKCPICKGKQILYTPNLRSYKGKIRDIGYWSVCKCVKKKATKR